MPQDAPPPGGLLSKVVKFVRNPTVNWSELDQIDERDSQYNKQVLKEMIERKRANDFVRKREFDQLRKLRQRGVAGSVPVSAVPDDSGFFDSSQPAGSGQREGTLKKIDEIEAQMVQQQWQRPKEAPAAAPQQFAPTVDAGLPAAEARVTDFAATDIQPREPDAYQLPQEDMLPGVDLAFGATGEQPDLVPDPGLEEAAIRFANGDDAGSEAALLALVETEVPAPVLQRAWAALFDLYCATGQHGRFDAMAMDYAARYHRAAPAWCLIAELGGGNGAGHATSGQALIWSAPALLDAGQVTALAVQLAQAAGGAVQLDWTALDAIQPEALAPLADALTGLAGRPVHVACSGAVRLEQLLRHHTVSGQRGQPPAWWRLRLAWLQLAQRADEFDLVALDYCMTYEVPPPPWQDVRGSFAAADMGQAAAAPQAAALARGPAPAAAQGRLAGVVAGAAADPLARVGMPSRTGEPLVVDCSALVRIDFAAAGAVLNWAATQQAAGQQVEFHGLHRLVATFFHVIGVAEHATVHVRPH